MKKLNKTIIFVVGVIYTLTFLVSGVQADPTKEECEKMCSDQQCRSQIWGPCHKPQTPCPATSILNKCEACRSIAPEVVEHCWNIYRHGEKYQGQ